MDDVAVAKVVSLTFLFLIAFIVGLLPIWVGKKIGRNNARARFITSILLCFGGGVLFATCFTHILPETLVQFNSYENLETKPIGEITLCAGFFFIYMIEEVVHFFSDGHMSHGHDGIARTERSPSIVSTLSHRSVTLKGGDHKDHEKQNGLENGKSNGIHVSTSRKGSLSSISTLVQPFCSPTSIRDFVTVVALSFHAVFEGLAIGLETEAADVWTLFGAVSAHKYIIAFSFGMELYQSGIRRSLHVLYVFTFAAMSAIGIGIGLAFSESAAESKSYILTTASLQALSAGTLLYVSLFEIVARERSKEDVNGMLQMVVVILGFAIMMMIDLLIPEPTNEDDEQETTTLASAGGESVFAVGKMAARAALGGIHK